MNENKKINYTPDYIESEEVKKVGIFPFYMLQNFPFIEETFDAVTYYQMLCKIVEYLNDVIKDFNIIDQNFENLDTNVRNLYEAYIKLQEYVNNYFDNLDVQNEINNKLDQMVLDGVFENILMNYTKIMKVFDTALDLLKDKDNLIVGQKCKTLGYYKINDRGAAEYIITDVKSATEYQEDLQNGLYATLISNNPNVNQFGAYGDGEHDDSDFIQKAINNLKVFGTLIFTEKSTYLISKTLNIPADINIDGNNAIIKLSDTFNDYAIRYNVDVEDNAINICPKINTTINKLIFEGNPDNFTNNNGILICQQVEISEIRFNNINKCIYFNNNYIDRAEVHNIYCNNRKGNDYAIYSGSQGDAKYFHHLQTGGIGENDNLISCGSNHTGIVIDNIILGSIKTYSPTKITNVMLSYYGKIEIFGSNCSLENIHLTKNKLNEHRIIVKADGPKLPNVSFKNINAFFVETEVEYSEQPISSILIDNCTSYKFTNVFSGKRYSTSYSQVGTAFEIIDFNSNNIINQMYNEYPNILNDKLIYSKRYESFDISESIFTGVLRNNLVSSCIFNKPNGDYFYRFVYGIDIDAGFGKSSSEIKINVVDKKSPRFEMNYSTGTQMPEKVRIFRGNKTGVYTEYADICYTNLKLIDDGLSLCGIAWKPVTERIRFTTIDNQNVIKNIKFNSLSLNKYNKEYISLYNPISKPSYYNKATFTKGDTLKDIQTDVGLYIYNTTWTKI